MMKLFSGLRCAALPMLILIAFSARSEGVPITVEQAVRAFVEGHPSTSGMPVQLRFGEWRSKEEYCSRPLEVNTSSIRLGARVVFRVRCSEPRWIAAIATQIVIMGDYWVANRFLPVGTVLSAADMRRVTGDLASLPEDVVRSESGGLGKVVVRAQGVGAPLLLNALKENAVIKAGERVRIHIVGSGFSIAGEGTAMSGGAVGDSLKLKAPDGQHMTGRIIRAGLVEVRLD